MIYRITANFFQAFDRLDATTQARALVALRGFKVAPRQPSREAHVLGEHHPVADDDDVWDLPFSEGYHITYTITGEAHPDEYVCILRNIGPESSGKKN